DPYHHELEDEFDRVGSYGHPSRHEDDEYEDEPYDQPQRRPYQPARPVVSEPQRPAPEPERGKERSGWSEMGMGLLKVAWGWLSRQVRKRPVVTATVVGVTAGVATLIGGPALTTALGTLTAMAGAALG